MPEPPGRGSAEARRVGDLLTSKDEHGIVPAQIFRQTVRTLHGRLHFHAALLIHVKTPRFAFFIYSLLHQPGEAISDSDNEGQLALLLRPSGFGYRDCGKRVRLPR